MGTMTKLFISLAASVGILALSHSKSIPQDAYVTNAELRAVFESGNIDDIVITLNTVKQMSYKGEILTLLTKIWQTNYWSDAENLKYVALLPIVRMEVANVLLQAERNGLIIFDPADARSETLAHIESQDVALLGVVISNLSIIDNNNDVEPIKQIALRRNPSTFRSAVLGLSTMCSENAALALDDLIPTAIRMGEHEHLTEVRNSMANIRNYLCR